MQNKLLMNSRLYLSISIILILTGVFMLLFSQSSILIASIKLLLTILSNGFKCSLCSLKLFNIVRIFLGAYFLFCGILTFLFVVNEKANHFFKENYQKIILFLIILVTLFLLVNSFTRAFDGDEGEFIHVGWHITQGEAPYVDFFEHHHIFLSYLIGITIKIFGESISIFYIWRGIMFVLALVFLYTAFKISRRLFNKEVALISLIFLATNFFFFMEIIRIRTDVPQVVFGLIGIYFFILFFERNNSRHVAICGFLIGISFLFSQKSIFLVASLFLILLYQTLVKRNMNKKYLFIFLSAFIVTILPYYIYLSANGHLYDYYISNWLFNMEYTDHFSIIFPLVRWAIQNTFLWIFVLIGGFYLFKTKKPINKTLIILFVLLFAFTASVRVPFRQYFLIITPLMALFASFGFCSFFRKQEKTIMLILLLLIIAPSLVLMISESMITNSNFNDIQKIKWIIQETNHDDYIYDTFRYNLFRKDVEFISWNQLYGLETFKKIKPGYQYNIYESIEKYKPKLISPWGIDLNNPIISQNYIKTKYDEYLIRKS